MTDPTIKGRVGTPEPHESAHLHVSGEARYTDDIPEPLGTLHGAIGMSEETKSASRETSARDRLNVCGVASRALPFSHMSG